MAEYAQGYQGVLRTTEIYFYLLDSLPLLLAMSVWIFVWPPTFLLQDVGPLAGGENESSLGTVGTSIGVLKSTQAV